MSVRLSLLLLALGFATSAPAQSGAAFDLAPWAASGQVTAGAAPQVLLPGGAQLSRPIPGTIPQVTVVSQPAFAPEPGNWPVLEVGKVAIVFALIDAAPAIVLADGPDTPVVLPLAPALGADGRSDRPISVTVELPGHRIRVSIGQEILEAPIAATEAAGVEVVLSAGTDRPWAIDRLAIPSMNAAVAGNPGNEGRGAASPATSPHFVSTPAESSTANPAGPATAKKESDQSTPPAAASLPAATGASGSLQVFTPPAVRYGRAEAIRAKVARKSGEAFP